MFIKILFLIYFTQFAKTQENIPNVNIAMHVSNRTGSFQNVVLYENGRRVTSLQQPSGKEDIEYHYGNNQQTSAGFARPPGVDYSNFHPLIIDASKITGSEPQTIYKSEQAMVNIAVPYTGCAGNCDTGERIKRKTNHFTGFYPFRKHSNPRYPFSPNNDFNITIKHTDAQNNTIMSYTFNPNELIRNVTKSFIPFAESQDWIAPSKQNPKKFYAENPAKTFDRRNYKMYKPKTEIRAKKFRKSFEPYLITTIYRQFLNDIKENLTQFESANNKQHFSFKVGPKYY